MVFFLVLHSSILDYNRLEGRALSIKVFLGGYILVGHSVQATESAGLDGEPGFTNDKACEFGQVI